MSFYNKTRESLRGLRVLLLNNSPAFGALRHREPVAIEVVILVMLVLLFIQNNNLVALSTTNFV
jgi:hypothetical protein